MSLAGQFVFVTGACGTVGRELVRQLLTVHAVGGLVSLDHNESELFFLEQEFSSYPNASFVLGDVRDRRKLTELMCGSDVVFHTAAYKHVSLCERSPFEAVQTNILGVQNVIQASRDSSVSRVVFTSSDKAVNPTNVMGASKLMGERLMTAANIGRRNSGPICFSVRFGNVLGSRGSVIPIFSKQIQRGGPVTLTDPSMTRFIMSVTEAGQLVVDAVSLAKGGEIFVTKMPAISIRDLAKVMIMEIAPRHGIDPQKVRTEVIGFKPGEKLYEELTTVEETRRVQELDRYLVVLPAFTELHSDMVYDYPGIQDREINKPYSSISEPSLSVHELRDFLLHNNLLYGDMSTWHA